MHFLAKGKKSELQISFQVSSKCSFRVPFVTNRRPCRLDVMSSAPVVASTGPKSKVCLACTKDTACLTVLLDFLVIFVAVANIICASCDAKCVYAEENPMLNGGVEYLLVLVNMLLIVGVIANRSFLVAPWLVVYTIILSSFKSVTFSTQACFLLVFLSFIYYKCVIYNYKLLRGHEEERTEDKKDTRLQRITRRTFSWTFTTFFLPDAFEYIFVVVTHVLRPFSSLASMTSMT